jgi:hypothetical protein
VLHNACPYAAAVGTDEARQQLAEIAAALALALRGGAGGSSGGSAPRPPRLATRTLTLLPTLTKQLPVLPAPAARDLGQAVAQVAAANLPVVLDDGLPDMAMLLYSLQRLDVRDARLLSSCEDQRAWLPHVLRCCMV